MMNFVSFPLFYAQAKGLRYKYEHAFVIIYKLVIIIILL